MVRSRVPPLVKTATARPRAPPVRAAAPAFAQLAGLGVLASVVIVHEAGHFAAARLQGIRVKEFSVGWGPTMLQLPPKEAGRPRYALRLLPLGGFVSFPRYLNVSKMREEDPSLDLSDWSDEMKEDAAIEPTDPDLLDNRPLRQQALVIGAGVAANLVFAWVCLFGSLAGSGVNVVTEQQVVVSRVLAGSAAERSGLRPGDAVVSIAGEPLGQSSDVRRRPHLRRPTPRHRCPRAAVLPPRGHAPLPTPSHPASCGRALPRPQRPSAHSCPVAPPSQSMRRAIVTIRGAMRGGDGLSATVERDGRLLAVSVPAAPAPPIATAPSPASAAAVGKTASPAQPSLGVELSAKVLQSERRRLPVLRAAADAARTVVREGAAIFRAFGSILSRLLSGGGVSGLQGPLGIAQTGGEIAAEDATRLLDFAAVLSLNLAAFNSLPLPGLDGFQMAILGVEASLRRKVRGEVWCRLARRAHMRFAWPWADGRRAPACPHGRCPSGPRQRPTRLPRCCSSARLAPCFSLTWARRCPPRRPLGRRWARGCETAPSRSSPPSDSAS